VKVRVPEELVDRFEESIRGIGLTGLLRVISQHGFSCVGTATMERIERALKGEDVKEYEMDARKSVVRDIMKKLGISDPDDAVTVAVTLFLSEHVIDDTNPIVKWVNSILAESDEVTEWVLDNILKVLDGEPVPLGDLTAEFDVNDGVIKGRFEGEDAKTEISLRGGNAGTKRFEVDTIDDDVRIKVSFGALPAVPDATLLGPNGPDEARVVKDLVRVLQIRDVASAALKIEEILNVVSEINEEVTEMVLVEDYPVEFKVTGTYVPDEYDVRSRVIVPLFPNVMEGDNECIKLSGMKCRESLRDMELTVSSSLGFGTVPTAALEVTADDLIKPMSLIATYHSPKGITREGYSCRLSTVMFDCLGGDVVSPVINWALIQDIVDVLDPVTFRIPSLDVNYEELRKAVKRGDDIDVEGREVLDLIKRTYRNPSSYVNHHVDFEPAGER